MRAFILSALFVLLSYLGYAQTCAAPLVVDFSSKSDTTVTIGGLHRNGNCCAGTNCISFSVKLNPGTDLVSFDIDQHAASGSYTVNCGPSISTGTAVCISGSSTVQITFCKPGNNVVGYVITAYSSITKSSNLSLRQGCTGAMSVTGFQAASTTWTSVYPGTTGAYNSYLSQTSGVTSVNVTPQTGSPAYIDYKVSGTESAVCGVTKSDTIRVYTFPPLTVAITPSSPLLCSGNPVTLTATPSGGDPSYTYLWSTGATTASISASTAGTYSVSVNDQTAACGAVTQQVVVTEPTTPTAAPATICAGNTATITATAPGGTYQWYDSAVNGTLLSSNASYTTPVLNTNTTYYVQTTNSGCASLRTAVTVTVNPDPTKPNISSP